VRSEFSRFIFLSSADQFPCLWTCRRPLWGDGILAIVTGHAEPSESPPHRLNQGPCRTVFWPTSRRACLSCRGRREFRCTGLNPRLDQNHHRAHFVAPTVAADMPEYHHGVRVEDDDALIEPLVERSRHWRPATTGGLLRRSERSPCTPCSPGLRSAARMSLEAVGVELLEADVAHLHPSGLVLILMFNRVELDSARAVQGHIKPGLICCGAICKRDRAAGPATDQLTASSSCSYPCVATCRRSATITSFGWTPAGKRAEPAIGETTHQLLVSLFETQLNPHPGELSSLVDPASP